MFISRRLLSSFPAPPRKRHCKNLPFWIFFTDTFRTDSNAVLWKYRLMRNGRKIVSNACIFFLFKWEIRERESGFFSFFKREKSWKEGIEVDKQNINQSMQQSFGPDFSKWSPLRRGAYTRGRTYVAAPPPPSSCCGAAPFHAARSPKFNLSCIGEPENRFYSKWLIIWSSFIEIVFFFFGSLSFSLILISFDNSNSFNNISKFSNSFNNSNSNR